MLLKSIKNQQGFTIIEVIIVIAIFSLLMIGLLNIFDWHNKVYFLERADTQATGSVRVAMNNIVKYIAQGSSVVSSRTISGTTYTSGSGTMVLQLPAFDSSGNLLNSIYDYVVFYKTGSNLYQLTEIGSGSGRSAGTKLLSSDVQSLTFSYNGSVTDATQVSIDITTQATSRGTNTTSAHVSQSVFLRNKQ